MSEVCLVIREAACDWSGRVHGSCADRAIAALSADPVTLEELERAMRRFAKPGADGRSFAGLSPGLRAEPFDAGLVILDLTARLIVAESTYSSPAHLGEVAYHDGRSATEILLRYHLAEDWLIAHDAAGWEALSRQRRAWHAGSPRDHRAIFYGRPLLAWIVRETRAAIARDEAPDDAIRRIHADWLLTPHEDLGGMSPREALLERRHHMSMDLQHRSEGWSILGFGPPSLAETSHAYRYGGFGTHELVNYYYLVRHLLADYRERLGDAVPGADTDMAAEVERLEGVRETWLDAPDPEYRDRTPRSIIHRERIRLPEAMTRGEEIIDPDCPCCRLLADMPGVGFWWLDGCNMDDEFAFDIHHRTRDEWEAQQREYEEWSRRLDAEREEKKRLGVASEDDDAVWKTSFVAQDSPDVPIDIRLFGIGCRLAEVIAGLRTAGKDIAIDRLNRDFGNLREILQDSEPSLAAALIEPVMDRFADSLAAAATASPGLALQCDALGESVRNLLSPSDPESEWDPRDGGVPF